MSAGREAAGVTPDTSGPYESRVSTLRYPVEMSHEEIMKEMEAGSREDRYSAACGD